MAQEAKSRKAALVKALVLRRDSTEYHLMVDLLQCMLAEAKDDLVQATPEQVPETQGLARAVQSLLTMLQHAETRLQYGDIQSPS